MGAEVVLAVPRHVIDSVLPEGFSCGHSLNEFAKAISGQIKWGDRAELKQAAEDAQAIAYNIYVIEGADKWSADLVVNYQRAKTVGEKLLHGDNSIGMGGHVDKATDQVVDDRGNTDFVSTLIASQAREDGEEISVTDADGTQVTPTYHHIGWINDNSNDIGKIHFAAVFLSVLPHGSSVKSNEPNQIMRTPAPLSWMLSSGSRYENWTTLALEALRQRFTPTGKVAPSIKSIGR